MEKGKHIYGGKNKMSELIIECQHCGGVDTKRIKDEEIVICNECKHWFWEELEDE